MLERAEIQVLMKKGNLHFISYKFDEKYTDKLQISVSLGISPNTIKLSESNLYI